MMMKNKIYESFEAIDNDLKILKLEKDIHALSGHVVFYLFS